MGINVLVGPQTERMARSLETIANNQATGIAAAEAKAEAARLAAVAASEAVESVQTRTTALETAKTNLENKNTQQDQTISQMQQQIGDIENVIEDLDVNDMKAVSYEAQSLTETEKAQVRTNIGAISPAEVDSKITAAVGDVDVSGVVKYEAQELTNEQKVQARANIGAASGSDLSNLSSTVSQLNTAIHNITGYVTGVEETEGGIKVIYDDNHEDVIQIDTSGLAFNSGYVDKNNLMHLTMGGEDLPAEQFTPFKLPAGGGGPVTGSVITVSNVTKAVTVRNGAKAEFSLTATASDDSGITATWYVNGTQISRTAQNSGTVFSFDAGEYLTPSTTSTVRVYFESEGGGTLARQWTVTSVAFAINWGASIDPIMLYTSNENVYALVNVSAESNTTNNVTLRVGSHSVTRSVVGSRSVTIEIDKSWFTTGVNTVTAEMVSGSNSEDKADDITYQAIWAVGATTPIVTFANDTIEGVQYDSIPIKYFAYDPENEITSCTITVGTESRPINATRSIQTYEYISDEAKTVTATLTLGSVSDTATVTVTPSEFAIGIVTGDSLRYNLNPVGHSNADADRESFGGMTFSNNFDWVNGGFHTDSNNVTAFVVKKGNRVTLPRSLFEESDVNGKTVDISFKIVNSDDYSSQALKDMDNGETKGFILRANEGEIRLNNATGQIFRYCEENRIDMSVLIEAVGDQRLATVWLDGIPSMAIPYTAGMLVQDENHTVIGSDTCDIWIYGIHVYNAALTRKDMVQNYVAAGNTTAEKVRRYRENDIYNGDSVDPVKLHTAAPNLTIITIEAPRMTTSKKDPVPARITIQDGSTVLELPAATGPETKDGTVFKVQGTSSAAYGRSAYNMDIDFKGTGKKYQIYENSIPVNYLNIKVNVASSENANNVNAVDWYNTYQPYRIEARADERVRDSVAGKPCAVFITNTNDEAVWFSSQNIEPGRTVLYAMGDLCNSKKNLAVFGEDGEGEHPTKACIEVSGNDTEYQRMLVNPPPYNAEDGEWQTSYVNEEGKTVKIKHFEWRMEPSDENLNDVVQAWNETVTWVVSTIDNPAKFKQEVKNYFTEDSLLFHFLVLEFFTAYDNGAKNTFYSFDWDSDADQTKWNGYRWNINKAYDMDTIIASDNDGKPLGDYGLDYGDTINGKSYFNAADHPIWNNIKNGYQTELSAMYISLRGQMAWSSDRIISKWDTYQSKRPHAAMVEDAYIKYIYPYQTKDVILNNEVKGYDDNYLSRMQGSKTYQRRQYFTYQTSYMDGKYGYFNTTDSMQFRTNVKSTTKNFKVKAYAKTYITAIVDSQKAGVTKVNAGETVTFNNVSVGTNTTLYFTPERLIQIVKPLNETQNSTFVAAGAVKLEEAILGGDTVNTSWDANSTVNIPSPVLKDLSIQNMANYSGALNMSANVELETVDTRGTQAGMITLPSYAPLTSVQLNACTGIDARNLNKVETFTLEGTENLVSVWVENCNTTTNTAIAGYLTTAVQNVTNATRRIRAIGVDWEFGNLDVLYEIVRKWKGYNANGDNQDAPVITGNIHVTAMSTKKLETINDVLSSRSLEDNLDLDNNVWTDGNLTIRFDSVIEYFAVTFLYGSGAPILDKQGNPYVQYIDRGQSAYDPIEAGEIDTPTTPPDAQYTYTFNGWINLTGAVVAPKTINPTFTQTPRTYTVRWLVKGRVDKVLTGVAYGAEVVYNDDPHVFPTLTDEESAFVYNVFKGWDKSTGFISEDTDVNAIFVRSALPNAGEIGLEDMSTAQIYGVAKNKSAGDYWESKDHVDIQVGRDFDFANVESEVLAEELYLDGSTLRKTNVKLFDPDAPSFTLAIDYEYTAETSNGTLVSCYDEDEQKGFRLKYYNTRPSIEWGTEIGVGNGLARGIVVIKHRKGSANLYIASDNPGNGAYNAEILTREIPRSTYNTTNAVLTFGGVPVGTSGVANAATGVIHWAKIWWADLGNRNVQQLACWPHETWRMHYQIDGNAEGAYRLNDGSGNTCSATFIANAPLALSYQMNATSTRAMNYGATELKTFANTRCFDALPYEWQAILQEVQVPAITGGTSSITRTPAKVYIPAWAELISINNETYQQEGSRLPEFTSPAYLARFNGFILPDNRQIIQEQYEPTTLSSYTVKDGDIWVNTSNTSGNYVYISAATAQKKGLLCGRSKSGQDSNIINASNGGFWVLGNQLWTRSATPSTDAAYFYSVTNTGSVNTWSLSSYAYSVYIMFSV